MKSVAFVNVRVISSPCAPVHTISAVLTYGFNGSIFTSTFTNAIPVVFSIANFTASLFKPLMLTVPLLLVVDTFSVLSTVVPVLSYIFKVKFCGVKDDPVASRLGYSPRE